MDPNKPEAGIPSRYARTGNVKFPSMSEIAANMQPQAWVRPSNKSPWRRSNSDLISDLNSRK